MCEPGETKEAWRRRIHSRLNAISYRLDIIDREKRNNVSASEFGSNVHVSQFPVRNVNDLSSQNNFSRGTHKVTDWVINQTFQQNPTDSELPIKEELLQSDESNNVAGLFPVKQECEEYANADNLNIIPTQFIKTEEAGPSGINTKEDPHMRPPSPASSGCTTMGVRFYSKNSCELDQRRIKTVRRFRRLKTRQEHNDRLRRLRLRENRSSSST